MNKILRILFLLLISLLLLFIYTKPIYSSFELSDQIEIEVRGEVKKEGLYKLKRNATLSDLLNIIELKESADISSLSLSSKLINKQIIIVPKIKEEILISINSASIKELMTLNENKGLEENIEAKLKEKFEYDSFVKINKDQINIVISSTKHDKLIANNIIKEVQSMFDPKKYITIKFQ